MSSLKIGIIGVTQGNFAGGAGGGKQKIFSDSVEGLQKLSKKLGFSLVVYPELLVTKDDAVKAKRAMEAEGIDFLLLQTTTFGAGEVLITLAKMNARLGVWALPEPTLKGSIYFDGSNSLCGLNLYGGIVYSYLKDYGIKYKWFFGKADDDMFVRRFTITVRALTALKKLEGSRIALVGGIAPGFNDLYYDERIGQKKLGIEIQRGHEFSEIRQRAEAYSEDEIAAIREEALTGYVSCEGTSAAARDLHCRYYKAHLDLCKEYGYDALAISCWPKMQDEADSYSCSIIGKLNQMGIPAACEGDLPGAVSMLLQKYVAEQPTTLMDLSGFNEEDESVLMWHCGPSPECLANENGACLCNCCQPTLQNTTVDRGMIIDMIFKPQPVTFMRITGEWDKMFLLDGKVLEQQKDSPSGSRGWIGNLRLNRQEIGARDLMNTILVQGMQHHYPMMTGDITEELMEIASWLGLKLLDKVPYEDYLQIR